MAIDDLQQSEVDKVLQQYPQMAYLINDPEVGPLLKKAAVDPEFSSERFKAEVMKTNWWRTTQESARKWDALVATDPASAKAQQQEATAKVNDLIRQSGIPVVPEIYFKIRDQYLRFGWSDAQLNDAIYSYAKYNAKTPGGKGELGVTQAGLQQEANRYFIKLADKKAFELARSIKSGSITEDAVKLTFQQQAMGKFPAIAEQIKAGISPSDYFAGHRSEISKFLEVPEEEIDFVNDPRWEKVLQTRDDKGQPVPMTISEAGRYARSLPDWQKTRNYKQSSTEAAFALAERFQGRAS